MRSPSSPHRVRRERANRVDAGLAAQPARARRVEVALEARVGRRDPGAERHIEHVVGVLAVRRRARAVPRRAELLARGDHALGDEEAGGEIEIVARRAHRDGECRAADPDLERLLDREHVLATRWRPRR